MPKVEEWKTYTAWAKRYGEISLDSVFTGGRLHYFPRTFRRYHLSQGFIDRYRYTELLPGGK